MRFCACLHALKEWQSLVNLMEAFMAMQRWIREMGEEPGGPIIWRP